MPYVPGDVFINTTYSTMSEMVANVASGVIFNMLGVKYSFMTGYMLAAIGSWLIATIPSEGYLMGIFVLFANDFQSWSCFDLPSDEELPS